MKKESRVSEKDPYFNKRGIIYITKISYLN